MIFRIYKVYIRPSSSMPASSSSIVGFLLVVGFWSSVVGCGVGFFDWGFRSAGFIELIIFLNSSNLSAGILSPFFVGPVYVSLFVNSRMSTPVRPLYSFSPTTISVAVPWNSPFGILPISFSIVLIN